MKYIIKSDWNGWDNAKNLKGESVVLTDDQKKHLEESGIKLEPENEIVKDKKQ